MAHKEPDILIGSEYYWVWLQGKRREERTPCCCSDKVRLGIILAHILCGLISLIQPDHLCLKN